MTDEIPKATVVNSATVSQPTNFCSSCGTKLGAGDAFCSHCGTAVGSSSVKSDAVPVALAQQERSAATEQSVANHHGAIYRPSAAKTTPESGSSTSVSIMCAGLGPQDMQGKWVVPKVMRLGTICGGIDLDMRIAEFVHPVTTLYCSMVCGGIDIKVPRGIRVVNYVAAVCGGTEIPKGSHGSDAPTIVVKGLIVCGAVSIEVDQAVAPIRTV